MAKDWTVKKDIWMISTWKGAQHDLPLERRKIRPQWDATTHL